jgi:hypothetical protein
MKGFNKVKQDQVVNYTDAQKVPDLMTEEELIHFLRIPEVSNSKDYSNVISNLIRMRNLPRIKICNKLLYPKKAIIMWIDNQLTGINT